MRSDESKWYCSRGGREFGPLPFSAVVKAYQTGRLTAEDQIWDAETGQRRPASALVAILRELRQQASQPAAMETVARPPERMGDPATPVPQSSSAGPQESGSTPAGPGPRLQASHEVEWFCYDATTQGLLTVEQCQQLAQTLAAAGTSLDTESFVRAVGSSRLCTDAARLGDLMDLAMEQAEVLGSPPVDVLRASRTGGPKPTATKRSQPQVPATGSLPPTAGGELRVRRPAVVATPSSPGSGKRCPSCRTEMKPGDVLCAKCGWAPPSGPRSAADRPRRQPGLAVAALVLGGVTFVLALVAYFGWSGTRPSQESGVPAGEQPRTPEATQVHTAPGTEGKEEDGAVASEHTATEAHAETGAGVEDQAPPPQPEKVTGAAAATAAGPEASFLATEKEPAADAEAVDTAEPDAVPSATEEALPKAGMGPQDDDLRVRIEGARKAERQLAKEVREAGKPLRFRLITVREHGPPMREKGEYSRAEFDAIMRQREAQEAARAKRHKEALRRWQDAVDNVRRLQAQRAALD